MSASRTQGPTLKATAAQEGAAVMESLRRWVLGEDKGLVKKDAVPVQKGKGGKEKN